MSTGNIPLAFGNKRLLSHENYFFILLHSINEGKDCDCVFSMKIEVPKGSFIQYVRKILQKGNVSYPMIRTRKCTYQAVKNVSFLENFANVLNDPQNE